MKFLPQQLKKLPGNISSLIKPSKDQKTFTILPPQSDNPWFYCSLCSTFHTYHDLIDGCICPICNKDLFVIPWFEVNNHLEHTSVMFRHGYWKPKRRKSWVG